MKNKIETLNSPQKADLSNSEKKTMDPDDLIDLQIFFDEIKEKYGFNLKINHGISAYENEVIAQKKCDEFWKDIFKKADMFMKIYESSPASYTTPEKGERYLNPENLENFTKMKLHPFSVIVIVNTIQKKETDINKIKNTISPLDNEKYSGISTAEFAHRIGAKPDSIRVRLCETGSYFGIKPHKLPNRRLLWPLDAVQQLIDKKRPKKH